MPIIYKHLLVYCEKIQLQPTLKYAFQKVTEFIVAKNKAKS